MTDDAKVHANDHVGFLSGGGDMGALMRSFDFSTTPLGPAIEWPQSLRSAVSICLNSRFPIVLYWGPQFISLYNDAYIPILGTKHPSALGQPFHIVWADIWDVLGPVLRNVFETGVPSWAEDQLLIFQRSGYAEEVYFTFSFGVGRNEEGDVGGIFCAVTETTQRVLHERRLAILKELSAEARTTPETARMVIEVLAHTPDIPFALLYLKETHGPHVTLACHCGLPEDSTAAPARIALTEEQAPWRLNSAPSEDMAVLTDLDRHFGPLPGRPWPEPATSAAVIPLKQAGQSEVAGYLILGISPRRAFDDAYRRFFELAGDHVAMMVSNARASENERHRAEALTELDRAKTAFFSNVSHEFRTPLTLMLGPLEDLLAKSPTDLSPSAKGQLEMVNRNGLRLLRLVNSLLDFSRIEADRAQARYEPIDLPTFTAELASSFRSATQRAGLELIVDCPPLSESVYIDREMWEKIVLNLISNAFKFTFSGRIVVKMRQREGAAELVVLDTGVGIPSEALPKLFERFYRVENMQSRTHEGSGIGLALVQELVKLHGGTVHADTIIGEGSSFTVTIPFGRTHLPTDKIGGTSTPAATTLGARLFVEEALRWLPDQAGGKNAEEPHDVLAVPSPSSLATKADWPHILLVDDNADMRHYVTRLLSERYTVHAVADGHAAYTAVQAQRPDLILSDVMMPHLDGIGLLQKLRNDPATETIPVILLSARAGEEARVEGLQHGADDYLTKPFSARELLARVRTHLDLAHLRQDSEARTAADLEAMTLLYEVGNRCLKVGQDFRDCLEDILQAAVTITGASKGTLQLFDPASQTLWIAAQQGFQEPFLSFFKTVGDRSWACGAAVTRFERIIVPDVTKSDLFAGTPALAVMLAARAHAVQSTPLTSNTGHLLGVISTHFSAPHRSTDRELRLMDLLARQAADFLERKAAEQFIRESEERLRLANLATNEAIWDWDVGSDNVVWNQNIDTLFGWSEALAAPNRATWWVERVHPDDRPRVADHFFAAVNDPAIVSWSDEYRFQRKDGSYADVFDRAYAVRDAIGKPLRMLGTMLDITERKCVESRLHQFTQELERQVTARTVELLESQEHLRALATEVNLAEQRERKRLAAELHDHLQQLLVLGKITLGQTKREVSVPPLTADRIKKVEDLLSDALAYTRTLVAELSPPVLRDHGLVAGIKWLAERMQKHEMTVSVRVSGSSEVILPEDQVVLLFQSVRELLLNAAKHAKAQHVSVSLDQQDAGVLRIVVSDQGIGFVVSPAVNSSSRGDSSKFGLFSIQERMRALGGSFEMHSAPGKGATAILTLPPVREKRIMRPDLETSVLGASAVITSPSSPVPMNGRTRLILVDDHAMVRQGLRAILENYADLEVVAEAGDGEEALAVVERLRPDVVVMDINMPKKNGIDATREIKARFSPIAIIGLSVNVDGGNAQAMRRAGASVLLTKEAAVEHLYTTIRDAMKTTGAG